MAHETNEKLIREAVGIFDNAAALEEAVDELQSSGFDRAEISLLAGVDAVEQKLGHKFDKVSELEDDASVPRAAFVSTASIGDAEGGLIGGLMYVGAVVAGGAIVASGGPLSAAIAGAAMVGGAGGLIGGILAKWFDEQHADALQDQLGRGGLLLWVRTWNAADEKRATEILSKHSAHDVHVHGVPKPVA